MTGRIVFNTVDQFARFLREMTNTPWWTFDAQILPDGRYLIKMKQRKV